MDCKALPSIRQRSSSWIFPLGTLGNCLTSSSLLPPSGCTNSHLPNGAFVSWTKWSKLQKHKTLCQAPREGRNCWHPPRPAVAQASCWVGSHSGTALRDQMAFIHSLVFCRCGSCFLCCITETIAKSKITEILSHIFFSKFSRFISVLWFLWLV